MTEEMVVSRVQVRASQRAKAHSRRHPFKWKITKAERKKETWLDFLDEGGR